jgi:flavin reductase (DIM6/NTAB) family NADH-FMN oxidoreductase RutF
MKLIPLRIASMRTAGAQESPIPEIRRFRQALARFPTGVIVATAWDETGGRYLGMTMSSFSAVSLDPPLVLFSVDRRALSLEAWRRVPGYAVNVLAEHQRALSERFARPRADKWLGVEFQHGQHRAPLLSGAVAHFECVPHSQYEAGDHITLFGRVTRFAVENTGAPLVFHESAYAAIALSEHPDTESMPRRWPLPIHY